MHVAAFGPWYVVSAHHSYKQGLTRLSVAQSHPIHLHIPTAETWTPDFPRLFGANPSWELFGQQIFRLSNKQFFPHNHLDHVWFLKWIAISADIALLRAFFSISSPTAGAVYEGLLGYARELRMSDLLRILFELGQFLRCNNPASFDEVQFVCIAVEIGSRPGDNLDIVNNCLSSKTPLLITKLNKRRGWASFTVLKAATRCDIAILRVLVDAGWKIERSLEFETICLGRIIRHIENWSSQQEHSLSTYIELLLRGGLLEGSASSQCNDDYRPQVGSITWDELVMVCPSTTRKALQMNFRAVLGDQGTCISRAGIFTFAQCGATRLHAYLDAHREDDAFLTRVTLEECLLVAAIVNDSMTASVLLEVGVDPYVGLLSNKLDGYQKASLIWNPSIVAAAAGHLEVLKLLLDQINLSSFLDLVPFREILHCGEVRQIRKQDVMEKRLYRVKLLRESYLNAEAQSSIFTAGYSLGGPRNNENGTERSVETLKYIRSVANAQGFGEKVDLEIIKAAVSHRRIVRLHGRKQYLPCDALLIKGLIDAHLEYKEEGMNLLHLSIRNHCSFTVARFLFDRGLKVHSGPGEQNRNSMLHDALLSDSPDRSEIVEFLLKEGADCRFCGEGLTILEASLWNWRSGMDSGAEFQRIFERLLDAGAPIYQWPRKRLSKWRPLVSMLLGLRASDNLILRVVDAGADLNACGYGNRERLQNVTPLQAAIIHRRDILARELICRGADAYAPASPQSGLTALQAACLYDLPIQFLEYLVDVLRVMIDEPPAENSGVTSLAGAVCGGSVNTVEFLLDHGVDVNAMCRFGAIIPDDKNALIRPLDLAVYCGSLDMVELLLKAGGRSRKAGLGGAINIATSAGHFAVLSILRRWDKKRGRQILDEEAIWQRRNPRQALMLSESANDPYKSDCDYVEDTDGLYVVDTRDD